MVSEMRVKLSSSVNQSFNWSLSVSGAELSKFVKIAQNVGLQGIFLKLKDKIYFWKISCSKEWMLNLTFWHNNNKWFSWKTLFINLGSGRGWWEGLVFMFLELIQSRVVFEKSNHFTKYHGTKNTNFDIQ